MRERGEGSCGGAEGDSALSAPLTMGGVSGGRGGTHRGTHTKEHTHTHTHT